MSERDSASKTSRSPPAPAATQARKSPDPLTYQTRSASEGVGQKTPICVGVGRDHGLHRAVAMPGPLTWGQAYVGTGLRGDRLTWGQAHVGTGSRGDRLTWGQAYVGTGSRGDRLTWGQAYVGAGLRGGRLTWGQAYVGAGLRGGRLTWGQAYVGAGLRAGRLGWGQAYVGEPLRGGRPDPFAGASGWFVSTRRSYQQQAKSPTHACTARPAGQADRSSATWQTDRHSSRGWD